MSTEDYTEEELAGLSEEERSAISDEDDIVDGTEDVSEDNEAHDDTEQVEEVVEEDALKDEPDKENTAEEAVIPEPAKQNTVPLPAEVADKFKAERAELSKKFDEGEIELVDLLDQRDIIARQEREAEVTYNDEVKAASDWQSAQDKFFSENELYLSDKERHAALDACVKAVANMPGVKSFDDCLSKAKRMEEAMNGVVAPVADKKVTAKSPRPAAPSIVDLPSAAQNESAGEFDFIDKLTGVELETALGKLTEAQQDRYLSGR